MTYSIREGYSIEDGEKETGYTVNAVLQIIPVKGLYNEYVFGDRVVALALVEALTTEGNLNVMHTMLVSLTIDDVGKNLNGLSLVKRHLAVRDEEPEDSETE